MGKTKLIESLTPEQEALIPVYREKYRAIGLSTEPTDKARAEAAIRECYRHLKLKDPEIVWATNPYVGAKIAAQLATGNENPTRQEIAAQADTASYGSFNAYWVSFYTYIAEVLNKEKNPLIEIVNRVIADCGVYWTFEDIVVITPKPSEIHCNAEGKLHNTSGKAFAYADGTGMYCLNGARHNSLSELSVAAKFASADDKQ